MSQRFTTPLVQAFGTSGSLLANAKLKFYETNSTTALDVYQDIGTETAFSPTGVVTSGTSGLFPDIFMRPAQYKVELETSGGAVDWTADPAKPAKSWPGRARP